MKNYFFLSGIARGGNTLLGSLLNQNKDIDLTANTILCDVLLKLFEIKNSEIYKNFPDEQSYNNIYKNVFTNYFNNWEANNIIIRGPWGTPGNLFLLKQIIKNPKHIILYRPVEECLASFIKIVKPKNKDLFITQMLNEKGPIGHSLMSAKNIINKEKNCLIIYYNNLIKNTEKEIKKIYEFINVPYKKLKFTKLNEFKSNNISYDDKILGVNLHKIKTKEIKKENYKLEDYLNKEIISQCQKMNIL